MLSVAVDGAREADISVESHSGAFFFCRELSRQELAASRVLVAGCGAGHEAAAIQVELQCEVDAVDVQDFVPDALRQRDGLRYQIASVTDLPFPDATFDAIFFYHVIEHVDHPVAGLQELRRVLTDQGLMFVGTPNRHRLASSLGAHRQSEWEPTIRNKLKDNASDWWARCRGKFRNEYGAHAGFTRHELDAMLAPLFTRRSWVTEQYLTYKYRNHPLRRLVRLAIRRPWSEFLAPSIYVFCG